MTLHLSLPTMIRTSRIVQRLAGRATLNVPQSAVSARSYALDAQNLPKSSSPIVSKLDFFNSVTGNGTVIPTYRVLDGAGKPLEGAEVPEVEQPFYLNKTR